MDEVMTTTAFTLEGYRIVESLGMSGVTEVLCYGTAVVVEPWHGHGEE